MIQTKRAIISKKAHDETISERLASLLVGEGQMRQFQLPNLEQGLIASLERAYRARPHGKCSFVLQETKTAQNK